MATSSTRWVGTSVVIISMLLIAGGCADGATHPGVVHPEFAGQQTLQNRIFAMREKHGEVGKYHNEGLAFVLGRLKTANARSLSPSARCKVAEKAARDFHVSVRRLKLPPGTPGDSTISAICERTSKPLIVRAVSVDRDNRIRNQRDLTPEALGYLEQIQMLIDTAPNVDQLRTRAYQIERDAISALSETEAGNIVEVISVLTSSADYWETNYTDWESQLPSEQPATYTVGHASYYLRSSVQSPPGQLRQGVSFRDFLRVVRADVRGAIGSSQSSLSNCTFLACRGFESFVASMREAIAPQ